jgi:hypothetical protein
LRWRCLPAFPAPGFIPSTHEISAAKSSIVQFHDHICV